MAATDRGPRGDQPRRRFVTRHDVEDAAKAGQPIRLGPRDVLTHEAAQRARDLGVGVEHAASGAASPAAAPAAARPATAPQASAPALRDAVRRAVIAELGSAPAGLDAVIDRVLAERRRGPAS